MDITKYNIRDQLEEIEKALKTSAFVALDLEFSGLLSEESKNSLFDFNAERYRKLRKGIKGIIATQVGLSIFQHDRNKNTYHSCTYNFYLCPQSVGCIQQVCTFQASALDFLSSHKFDFNKVMHEGLPYLNNNEKDKLLCDIKNDKILMHLSLEASEQLSMCDSDISRWLRTAKKNECLEISGNAALCYFMTLKLKKLFPKLTISNLGYMVKVINKEAFNEKTENEEAVFINYALGFSHIVKLLDKSQKPLVFHNALSDIMILYHQFIEPLPGSYNAFKKNVHKIFPNIYDTKHISNLMKFFVKREFYCDGSSLKSLYEFFKNPKGLHLATYTPYVTMKSNFKASEIFHEAGWDSYCTGYIFIRLCHWSACIRRGIECEMSNTEHMNSMNEYINCIYISRAAQLYLRFGSSDPPSHRPQYLHLEVLGNNQLSLPQIVFSLSKHGSLEAKKYGPRCALLAVTNVRSADKILAESENYPLWKISPYRTLQHSRFLRMALWSGFFLSSGSLLILMRCVLFRNNLVKTLIYFQK